MRFSPKKAIKPLIVALLVSLVVLCGAALVLATLVPAQEPRGDLDNLDFTELATDSAPPPETRSYTARDGTELSYRHYPAQADATEADTAVVLLHGSAYHSGYLAPLAHALADQGAAEVYTPDLRGHGPETEDRGDVDHIGQLEEDLADFAEFLDAERNHARLLLAGHSSGGGTALRFAGGQSSSGRFDGYALLAPYIHHTAPTYREGTWATVNTPRMAGLSMLNAVGVTAFNAGPVISFNMPERRRDGTETLQYSYDLQISMHPRGDYAADIAALPPDPLVLAGTEDETFHADRYPEVFAPHPTAEVRLLEGVSHFGVVNDEAAQQALVQWVEAGG
ncbi:alpha/beta hydrolase [Lipingzhangella sp. LS1_29]|uniref:Alpha/beta hydrolase n=1 Tax=Lipingzhangella rawalii TaxID=2055835 RepID=A0ABU2H5V0_9ACTN|nr:alpha/beta hydrolase [Lipingzhangella rawalii]MDS1270686.1 alpha/beta hydrolase [Lipingzhangella rawalii]